MKREGYCGVRKTFYSKITVQVDRSSISVRGYLNAAFAEGCLLSKGEADDIDRLGEDSVTWNLDQNKRGLPYEVSISIKVLLLKFCGEPCCVNLISNSTKTETLDLSYDYANFSEAKEKIGEGILEWLGGEDTIFPSRKIKQFYDYALAGVRRDSYFLDFQDKLDAAGAATSVKLGTILNCGPVSKYACGDCVEPSIGIDYDQQNFKNQQQLESSIQNYWDSTVIMTPAEYLFYTKNEKSD